MHQLHLNKHIIVNFVNLTKNKKILSQLNVSEIIVMGEADVKIKINPQRKIQLTFW